MTRPLMIIAGSSGALAVAMGAVGAHLLRHRVTPDLMETFRTGADHHMYCSIALLLVAVLSHQRTSRALRAAAILFVCGIVLFAVPCYAIAMLGLRQLGAIAPVGGIAMITAWILVAVHAWTARGER